MKNIAVLASGGGSDLQAIIDACKSGTLDARVRAVISNNGDSRALRRAESEGIAAFHLSSATVGNQDLLDGRILEVLHENEIHVVFLAGYLKKIGPAVLAAYENRIFNIHPSLLPKRGGRGMYGINVHKSVLEAGDTETGVTIHRVSGEYDSGGIVAQTKVTVLANDTPETLAARVLEREHVFIVETLSGILATL